MEWSLLGAAVGLVNVLCGCVYVEMKHKNKHRIN